MQKISSTAPTAVWIRGAGAGSPAPLLTARAKRPPGRLWRIWLSTAARRIPVGVIGPRECGEDKLALAEQVGAGIGALGLTMICGGRTGVMAAAAKGCRASGGLTVGMLPGHDWREANDDIMLPIATGLSEARNMIIAKSCAVLVAIGGSYGTLSEIAYGLHFSKPVIVLGDAPDVEGTERANDPEDAIERLAAHLMASARMS